MQNRGARHGMQRRCVMHLKGCDIGEVPQLNEHPGVLIGLEAGRIAYGEICISRFGVRRIRREVKRIVLPAYGALIFPAGRVLFIQLFPIKIDQLCRLGRRRNDRRKCKHGNQDCCRNTNTNEFSHIVIPPIFVINLMITFFIQKCNNVFLVTLICFVLP